MGKKILKGLLEIIIYFVCIFGLAWFIVNYVVQQTTVDGISMESTLHDGDRLFMSKISYEIGDPKRFDVVVFPVQYEEDTYYIKRVIGLPGETVQIDENGLIYINGQVIAESYGKEVIKEAGTASNEITLGSDEYFVLGDNRNHSLDSRVEMVGLIKRKDIVGKAFFRIYPLDDFGLID